MATTTLNFSSQRISFVNKIGLILKATADDEQPTPGYLYREINDISFESVGNSESLVEFIVDRLKNQSCHVKFKVLKLMKHLMDHGSSEFILGLKRHSDGVKECIKFGGPPHPMHGNVPYLMVRKVAKEVCESLYSANHAQVKSETSQRSPEPKYGGFGSVHTGGAIQGFGNTPTSPNKGFGEVLLGEIEKLSSKMSETPADRQAALLAKLDLSGSVSNYQPPVLDYEDVPAVLSPASSIDQTHNALTTTSFTKPVTVKKYRPGKAGGRWGDDDDDSTDDGDDDSGTVSQLSFETDSLADPTLKLLSEPAPTCECQPETDLVMKTVRAGNTGAQRALLAPSNLRVFQVDVALLNCDKVVRVIAQKLLSHDPGVVLRCLQLLECIVYNSEELVGLELMTSTCRQALVTCYTSCNLHVDDPTGTIQTQNEIKIHRNLWSAVKAKCVKVILILQEFSSQKDILPQSGLLSGTRAVPELVT